LGHIRWRIENNGFKQLSAQTNCDHVYSIYSFALFD